MRVAVFARIGTEAAADSMSWLLQCVQALAASVHFAHVVVVTDCPLAFAAPAGRVEVVGLPVGRHFWQRLGLQRQWQKLALQLEADVVLHFGLNAFFRSVRPSFLFADAADFTSGRLYRHRKQLGALHAIGVASPAAREKILALAGVQGQKVLVVPGAPPPASLVETDTGLVKERFTGGAEFFLYQGTLQHNGPIINLLKAFSRFKRRQKSGWKLVLAQESTPIPKALHDLLANYKYREDVVLADQPGPEVVESLYAAAYCFVYPAAPAYYGRELLQALTWALPVIGTDACREWAGDAGLYAAAGDEDQLAEHLMQVYKDEGLRGKLSAAAQAQARGFSWQPLVKALAGQGYTT